ncbi:hypothetical protein M3629_08975 [Paenibacillus polysaccharolyticus]|uniref:hypothetical protein n=1 Tax=Paenibacillus polysaccharolyticus TaxID=582692 RepID=UPI00203EE008|nr:hypothetical protein [Paenibacillus polysaccharolyticus]MCM3132917.1 hypothetical protein [Paenibacillus polysaccharolyticus]
MAVSFGELIFVNSGNVTTLANAGTVVDVMVGDKVLYIVNGSLSSVSVYVKNADGSVGSFIRTVNWYSNDAVIGNICENNSSVPYAYAVFIDKGQDYLVGWSKSGNTLYYWTINTNTSVVTSRVAVPAPMNMVSYSRGGWDGENYVYFWNRANNGLYRWDTKSKATSPVLMTTIGGGHSLSSSYTGSGLWVTSNFYYWGSGANQSNGTLGCFRKDNGVYQGSLAASSLSSIGGASLRCIQVNPVMPSVAYYIGANNQVQVLNLTCLVTTNVSFSSTIHDENLVFNFDVDNETAGTASTASWQVKVNGNLIIPFGAMSPIPVSGNSITLNNNLFALGENTVTIEMKDNFGGIHTKNFTVTVVNKQPLIVTSVDKASVHSENVFFEATVTDEDLNDGMTYRVLLNGAVYSDWSVSQYTSPLHIRRSFRASELVNGVNTITVEAKDNFKTNTTIVSGSSTVTKVNSKPVLDLRMKGNTISGTINDADGDLIQYRVLLNGDQVIPEESFSVPFPVPYSFMYTIPLKKFKSNQSNTVTVECRDSTGDSTIWTFTGILKYSGLMFKDPTGNYYTTEFGLLIKYLDLGVNYARQKSEVFEIAVENTLGYPVKNLRIKADQLELDPVSEKIEFSEAADPFDPQSILFFSSTYDTGQSQKFYVRLNCNADAVGGGVFKILVTADAL